MSKSLGNFEPLVDLLKRHDPQAIRLVFLSTGYSKVMNFTEESMAAAYATLDKLKKTYRSLAPGPIGGALLAKIESALENDMNTSVALSEVLAASSVSREEFDTALSLLGVRPNPSWQQEPKAELPDDVVTRVEAIITLRTQARANKNWAESDRLRDELATMGVAIKDSKEGTTWTVNA